MKDSNAIVMTLAGLMPQALADKRHPVYVALGAWLIDVVQTGKRYQAVVEDTGYDVSSFSRPSDEPFDLSQYQTAAEFLDIEVGPNTRATYITGMGFSAETLDEVASEVCREAFTGWVELLYPGVDFFDLWDDLSDGGADEAAFHARFREWTFDEILSRYLSDALSLRACRREAEEERERKFQESSAYGAMAFALMKQRLARAGKFERNRLKELRSLLGKIEAELPDGHRRITAALMTAVWPFEVSNSVRASVLEWYTDECVAGGRLWWSRFLGQVYRRTIRNRRGRNIDDKKAPTI